MSLLRRNLRGDGPLRMVGRSMHRFARYGQLSRKRSFRCAEFTTLQDTPFQITTPIYYVNDKPHIGHAYTSTACDVIARFMRLSGRDVYFLTGTDEHGQVSSSSSCCCIRCLCRYPSHLCGNKKVEQSAAQKGMEPQQFVDQVSEDFRDLLELLNISNDHFIRTTDVAHKESVQVWNTQEKHAVHDVWTAAGLAHELCILHFFLLAIMIMIISTFGRFLWKRDTFTRGPIRVGTQCGTKPFTMIPN